MPIRLLRPLVALPLLLPIACSDGSGGSSASAGGSSTGEPNTTDPGSTGGPTTDPGSTGDAGSGTTTTAGPTTSDPTDPTTGTATTTDATTGDTTTGGLETFLIGVDVTDISPSDAQIAANNIFMGAYGAPYARGPAQGVHDAIHARSFAFEAEGGGLIMTIVDLPGMGNQNTRAVRQKVAAMTGLAEGQILVATTHTHSAPDLMGLWGGVPGEYRNFVNDAIAMSMAAAWNARQPGKLRVATGKAPNNNRRDWGFTDDDMIVLDAFDLSDNRLGTLVNFAAHPVVLGEDNKEISCDYVGYTEQKLTELLGAPTAIFNGTLGDATPKVPEGNYADDFERAQAYGELLADIAADLADAGEPVDPTLQWTFTDWEQTVDNALFKLAAQLGILQYDFEMIDFLNQKVTTQSTYFRLGAQVQGVAFPGESVTRNGLAIKEAMKAPHRMLLGNTGDALGYFIPSDEWQTGKNNNYEESVSLGKTAGDNARDNIVPLITADNANF